ncbi:hypothetical protein ACQY74_006815 (plasmid) [Rhizobium leguminosarum bv. trifolii]|jgi:hypothetical protein
MCRTMRFLTNHADARATVVEEFDPLCFEDALNDLNVCCTTGDRSVSQTLHVPNSVDVQAGLLCELFLLNFR